MDAKQNAHKPQQKPIERSSSSANAGSGRFDIGSSPSQAVGNQVLQRLVASGHLPVALLPGLASTIGNQAMRRLVQGKIPQRPATIQRDSEETLRTGQPINWFGETTTVDKAAEGISGGFYIMTSAGGKLGVKPDEE